MALRRFLSLKAGEKLVVLEAVVLLAVVRMALVLIPLPRTLAGLQRVGSMIRLPNLSGSRVLDLTERTSRHLPFKVTCLSLALVAQTLLMQSGGGGVLTIGVKRMSPDWIEAHAWLEEEGKVVLGGPQHLVGDYTPILKWDGV